MTDTPEPTAGRAYVEKGLALHDPAHRPSMGDPAAAEASFGEALAIARQRSAKLWELRAATSLARLWRDRGKPAAACALLAPVYGWFTEGFDTADLKDAKALLEELADAAALPAGGVSAVAGAAGG